jgi:hypothetical protein
MVLVTKCRSLHVAQWNQASQVETIHGEKEGTLPYPGAHQFTPGSHDINYMFFVCIQIMVLLLYVICVFGPPETSVVSVCPERCIWL